VDTSRYAELFLTESQDNLSAINHALLELERTPTAREPIGALFRAVHTVKGMSATMGYAVVAELSHELETLLDLVRRGERPVTGSLMDTLFAATDMLEQAIELSVARPRSGHRCAATDRGAASGGDSSGDWRRLRGRGPSRGRNGQRSRDTEGRRRPSHRRDAGAGHSAAWRARVSRRSSARGRAVRWSARRRRTRSTTRRSTAA
jgi:chemotaxis protein histidine kinase CheA